MTVWTPRLHSRSLDHGHINDQEEAGPSGLHPLDELAGLTEGFSGSDLHQLCKAVAAIPVHEALCRCVAVHREDISGRTGHTLL